MGFKDIIQNIGKNQRNRKEMIRQLDEQVRIQKLVEERSKSANERELNRFENEEREEQITEALKVMRERRQQDIDFGHNPLNAKNITGTEWELLKEKNQFAGRTNMFKDNDMIHKSNSKLLHSGNILKNNNLFKI